MQYFVVMIDYGRRGREAIVDPEITRREVVSRVASGEYRNISFIHEVADSSVEDVTSDILNEAALLNVYWLGSTRKERRQSSQGCMPQHDRSSVIFSTSSLIIP